LLWLVAGEAIQPILSGVLSGLDLLTLSIPVVNVVATFDGTETLPGRGLAEFEITFRIVTAR
jgi:hypothetical protein